MKNKTQKLSSLNIQNVKKWVKDCLISLPDYTVGEEKFLISDATNLDVSKLLILKEFDKRQVSQIKYFVKQRLKGKPLNKISKKAYFYGEEFFVNTHVLSPRKETELLVEVILQDLNAINNSTSQILDLCCGSGAIGLTLAKHKPNAFVTLSDISLRALRVTKKNQKKLNVAKNTKTIKADLFKGLKKEERFDIIVCNPPYIATSEIESLQKGVKKYEPKLALDGGQDGLKFYKFIAEQCSNFLTEKGKIYLEIGFNQNEVVSSLFEQKGFNTICIKDYSGLDRIIVATK